MKYIITLTTCLTLLSACAPSAKNVQASYVSPLQYQDFSCKQIRAELGRITRKVHEVSGVQDSHASKDSVALGVGLVLFWPALFFMPGSDHAEELARLKGEYDAIEQAAIQKNCDVAQEISEARRMEEKRSQEKMDANKKAGQLND